MAPAGATHGRLQSQISVALGLQGEAKGHGRAYAKVAIVLERRPDHIVAADAALIAKQSLPAHQSPEGYLETIPELAVEIRDKNDTSSEIDKKVADYLKAGCVLVWVVKPDPKSVTEYRPQSQPKTYRLADSLSCDDIIPGFHLPLAELFED